VSICPSFLPPASGGGGVVLGGAGGMGLIFAAGLPDGLPALFLKGFGGNGGLLGPPLFAPAFFLRKIDMLFLFGNENDNNDHHQNGNTDPGINHGFIRSSLGSCGT